MGSRSSNALKVLKELYERPLIDANRVVEITGISPASAYTLIEKLVELEYLKEITGGKRKKQYMLTEYIGLFL
ncbi:MAG: hypothetical protein LUE98_03060 [Tannerellaceae bacterium]|nr:hypothetical protein [Tannerellaceae bacterium]